MELVTWGEIITASFLVVPTFLSECASTNAPKEYVSLVAKVTKASSSTEKNRKKIKQSFIVYGQSEIFLN